LGAAQDGYDLEKFFNFAVDMLCIADTKGFFRKVNPSFERVLGYDTDELLATSYLDLVHPEDREQTLAEVGKLAGGQLTLAFENRFRCKDGSYKYLSWASFPEEKTGLLYAVARDITERKLREDRVDGITGAPNRRVFDERLQDEWRRAARIKLPFSIALIDVDGLRAFNDVHGHLEGDKSLRRIAGLLGAHVRRAGDLIARYDGGTFGVLFAGGLEAGDAARVCERMRLDVHAVNLVCVSGVDGRLTVSCGVSSRVPTADVPALGLVEAAAGALAAAKRQGKNRIVEVVAG